MALRGSLKSGLIAYSIRMQPPLPECKLLEGRGHLSGSLLHLRQYLVPSECLLSVYYQTDQLGWEATSFLIAA